MDPGYLLRAAVLIYAHRALSVRSSIFGCCQWRGKGRKGEEKKGYAENSFQAE